MKHPLERGVIVVLVLERPLLGELWVGQELCEGLDVNLLEVVVLGLVTRGEVGLVIRPHLLFWRSTQCYTTALKVVEEGLQEIEREREEEEVGWCGELQVEE